MREVFRLHLLFVLALLVHSAASAKKIHRYGRAQSYDRPPDFYPQQQQDIIVTVYPHEKEVREGTEAIFDCRARSEDGSVYPEVRWSRAGGQLPSHAHESGGRLTISSVQTSDSGSYLCSASHMGQLKQAQAHLRVQSYGAQDVQGVLQTSSLCRADERACGNNECVKADYVCDGEPDCRDRSDELNCPSLRACEPNEFKCNNGRCVQKMWLCDGDDDCGDNSDEQQCQHKKASDGCGPTEFRCRDGQQCVLSSFQCDGTNDCRDGSDEVGCVQPTVVQAPETNKQVQAGGTFQLTCRAVAVPEPYINWRLNWGPVCDPPRCLQHSEGGLGTLTINDAQPLDQGAYTCEAINVKGRVLATPDCIVRIVSIPSPTYEPRPQPQVHCDPAGSMSQQVGYGGQCQCKPLATGPSCGQCVPGSYHLNNKAPQGCLKCFCFGVTDQCRSSSWYRSKEKLQFTGDSQGVTISDSYERDVDENAPYEFVHPGMITYSNGGYGAVKYWRMPQRFLGNRISSYGGELAFDVQHSCSGQLSQEPLVIIKGNKITLIHRPRDSSQLAAPDRSNRVTVDTYETNFEHENGRPASREDLVMVLADLSSLMIRATHCDDQRSTSLGDVSWEIAVDRDTQDRLALEVEQCSCPPGYTGLSCEECAPGYERSGHGPYLGTCVPARGAPQCSAAGAVSVQPSYGGACQCKAYAIGAQCDQCPPNSFHMSAENPQGCIPCFCSGVTQQCSQSGYSRATIEINYMQGSADQLEVTTSDIHAPFQPQSRPQLTGREISYSSFYETPGQTLYWKMPAPFLGNKVTSYGGTLKYVFRYSGAGSLNGDPDVIIRGNDIMLSYKNPQPTHADRENVVEVKLFENHWTRIDGQPATREHLLMALSDLDHILIKMNYLDDCSMSSLISVSLEHAEPQQTGNRMAYEVEQCVCPPGYMGTSCEDCAPGYSRVSGGLYLGLCERCECHGHATQCDKEHGFCIDCQHNTEGDQCERCKPGFSGDARRGTPHDCQPAATRPPCNCNNHSPRGCDSFGRCLMCEHSTEGIHCEQCKKGYYGDATRGTPYDCTPCPCPAASDCFLDPYGQVQCRNCPAGFSGRLCDECAPGYTRSRTHGGRECEPIGHVGPSDVVFVPTPEVKYRPQPCEVPQGNIIRPSVNCLDDFATLRVQIDQPKNLHVQPGGTAQWYCRIVGPRGPNLRLEWTKVGTNALPSSAIQTNGQLIINNAHEEDAGQYRCTAQGPHQFATDDATLVVAQRQPKSAPEVDPPMRSVEEGETVTFRCTLLDSEDTMNLHWRREDGSPLGYGVTDENGILTIPRAEPSDAGTYVCYTDETYGDGAPLESQPAYLTVNPAPLKSPEIDQPERTIQEGQTVTFRCTVPGDPDAELHWRKADGERFRSEITDDEGVLTIPSARQSDAGAYICTVDDPDGSIDSPLVYLTVNPRIPSVNTQREVVNEGETVILRCEIPSANGDMMLSWHREDLRPLRDGITDRKGALTIDKVEPGDAGAYVCSAVPRNGVGVGVNSPLVYLVVKPTGTAAANTPIVDASSDSVNEDAPVRFRCYLPGSPDAEVEWTKEDGSPINENAIYEQGVLTIMQTKPSDSGSYVCTVKDPLTANPVYSSPIHLNVNAAPPKAPIVVSPEETVNEGAPVRLRCYLPGNLGAKLSWIREDGAPLGSDVTDEQGILTIPQAKRTDAGSYICLAQESDGAAPLRSEPARIIVNAPDTPLAPPTPTVEISSDTVVEGQAVRLTCHIPNRPEINLYWKRQDGSPLPSDAVELRGTLTIMQTKASDSGAYVCATGHPDDYDTLSAESMPIHLTVTSTEPEQQQRQPEQYGPAATPTVDVSSDTVVEGSPVRFTCHVPNRPDLNVYWKRQDGNPLSTDSDEQRGTLTIMKTVESDSGAYICSTGHPDDYDTESVDSAPVHLTVTSSKPSGPLLVSEEETVNEGDYARLRCYSPGVDDSELHWRREDGREMSEGTTDEHGILTIAQASPSDAGVYLCSMRDPSGYEVDSLPARITVNSVASDAPIVEPSSVSVIVEHPVRIRCYVRTNPRAELHWRKQGSDEDVTGPGITQMQGYLSITKSQFSDSGVYVCAAKSSPHGSAVESPPVQLTVNPIAPREPVVNPPQQTIDEGSSARFQCYVPGDPSAQISWHRQDGAPLGSDVSESNGMLTITNAQASDAGAYVCHAQQAHTTQPALSSPVYLNVNPQQSVHPVVDPPSQSVDEGSPARFRCYVPGNPSAQLSWRKEDGSALGYDVTDSQGMLSFSRASPSDAGAYICSFQDPHGGAPVQSSPAYLGINPRRPSNPVVEPPSQTVDDGDHAKFRCFLPGVPDAQITWRKMDGSQLGPDVSDNRGMLTFQRAQSSDAGAYICTAQDSRGGHPVDAPPAYLNVNPRKPGTAPALMIDPSSQTVNENEPAQFKCWVPGVLACELTWHHEYIGGPLPYGVYQSGGILKIPRAQLHDAGNYICTASNQYGIGQSPPAHLTVNRPPQAPRVDPPEITVNDGDPARFRCWVPGDPSAKLEWHLRTGEPLPQGVQENEGILNFQSARQHHSNGYVCTATDPDGRNPPMQSSEVRLNVRKPKAPSVEPATLTVNEGDSIEIRCWSDEIEDAELHWRRADGDPLGYGISEARDGTLSTDKVRLADAGEYICSATDPQTEHTADSEPVQLNVGSESSY